MSAHWPPSSLVKSNVPPSSVPPSLPQPVCPSICHLRPRPEGVGSGLGCLGSDSSSMKHQLCPPLGVQFLVFLILNKITIRHPPVES